MMKKHVFLFLIFSLLFVACIKQQIQLLEKSFFDVELDGKEVSLYTLDSGNGMVLQVTNFGLRVVSLWVLDKNENYQDIVAGYENIDRYINNQGERFLGSIVGRYANRIAKGKFELDDKQYKLALNNDSNTLHGGFKGLDMIVWDVDQISENSIRFSYISSDGEEGFPGTVKINVDYILTPNNEFKIIYEATTDKPTVINLSHHSFFNLKGNAQGGIEDHILMINAEEITPIDKSLIPTGEILSIEGTPFDFRQPKSIGERIDSDNYQLKCGLGYDHNWVLEKKITSDVELAASLYAPLSGIFMEVYTDQPGLQFYSGNFFDGKVNDKYGKTISFRKYLALETQKFPDSPNQSSFPSTRLNVGETYRHVCIYKFSVRK